MSWSRCVVMFFDNSYTSPPTECWSNECSTLSTIEFSKWMFASSNLFPISLSYNSNSSTFAIDMTPRQSSPHAHSKSQLQQIPLPIVKPRLYIEYVLLWILLSSGLLLLLLVSSNAVDLNKHDSKWLPCMNTALNNKSHYALSYHVMSCYLGSNVVDLNKQDRKWLTCMNTALNNQNHYTMYIKWTIFCIWKKNKIYLISIKVIGHIFVIITFRKLFCNLFTKI